MGLVTTLASSGYIFPTVLQTFPLTSITLWLCPQPEGLSLIILGFSIGKKSQPFFSFSFSFMRCDTTQPFQVWYSGTPFPYNRSAVHFLFHI